MKERSLKDSLRLDKLGLIDSQNGGKKNAGGRGELPIQTRWKVTDKVNVPPAWLCESA